MCDNLLTWNELYDRALGTACGDWRLKAKDTARGQVRSFSLERGEMDPEDAEIPEDKIEEYCDKYEIFFDENGNIATYKNLDETSEKQSYEHDDRRLQLRTNKGYFDVTVSQDPNYPGIDIEFVSNDDNGTDASRPRIVFELTENKNLRALIWDNPNSEDYTREIEF